MNIEDDFNHFMKCLIKAGTNIDSHYFKLSVAGRKEPTFRERVYCYELYHQLRCTLGDGFPYKLDGEVDKAGHLSLQGGKKPDFIVHVPGEMEQNLAVIEVKPITARISRMEDDLTTLQGFLDKAKYHWAIMLIYGDDSNELNGVRSKIDSLAKEYAGRILLVWHRRPGEEPEVVQNV